MVSIQPTPVVILLLCATACGPGILSPVESAGSGSETSPASDSAASTGTPEPHDATGSAQTSGTTTVSSGTWGTTGSPTPTTSGDEGDQGSSGTTNPIDDSGGSSSGVSVGASSSSGGDTSGGVVEPEPMTWPYHDPHWELVRGFEPADDGVFVFFLGLEDDNDYWGHWVKLNETTADIEFEVHLPEAISSALPLSASSEAFFVLSDIDTLVLERRNLSTGALEFAVPLDTQSALDLVATDTAVYVLARTGGDNPFATIQMLSPTDGSPIGWAETAPFATSHGVSAGAIETDGVRVVAGAAGLAADKEHERTAVVVDATTGQVTATGTDPSHGVLAVMAPGGPYFTTRPSDSPTAVGLATLSGELVFSTEDFSGGQIPAIGVSLVGDQIVVWGSDTNTGQPRYELRDATTFALIPEFGDNGALVTEPWEDGHSREGGRAVARNGTLYSAHRHLHANLDGVQGFRHWYIERHSLLDDGP